MPNIFGLPTPQEAQQAQLQQTLQMLAQSRPGQALGVLGGQGLTRGVGGLLGVEDQAVARARGMQEAQAEVMQSGLQPGQEGYIDAVTRALANRGLHAEAAQARANGAKIEQEILKAEKLGQEVGATRRRNEALKARGPYAETFSLLLEGQTADKKNALNIANSTDAATLMAQSGIDSNLYAAFVDGVANDVQATFATNVSQTSGGSAENLDTGATSTSSTRSARISQGQLQSIVAKNLQQLGIDLGSLSPSGRGSTSTGQTRQSIQVNPQAIQRAEGARTQPQSVARSPVTNRPYAVGRPPSGEEAPRQPTTELPVTDDGRTLPKRELRSGRVWPGGRDGALEDFSQIAKNGKVAFGASFGNKKRGPKEYMRQVLGHDPATIKAHNERAVTALQLNRKTAGTINSLAEYILENGDARPALIGQAVRALRETSRFDDNLLSSGIKLSAALLSFIDATDPKDRKVIEGISQRMTDIWLAQKEAARLGVLNGPDLQLMQQLFPSPSNYTNRVNGVRAWYENASGVMEGLYRNASNAVNDGGIKRFDLPAPTSVMRFFSHMSDPKVQPVVNAVEQGNMTPLRAAAQLSGTLGFRVTPRMVNLAAAQNEFRPQGSNIDVIQRNINNVIDSGREAIGLTPKAAENRQPGGLQIQSPFQFFQDRVRRALGD